MVIWPISVITLALQFRLRQCMVSTVLWCARGTGATGTAPDTQTEHSYD